MNIIITGGCKNGKSSLAQEMAVALSKGGSRYYIATMIPVDDEDRARIAKHVADRAGLGFKTIECGRAIEDVLKVNDGKGAYLLDSVTALLANEMFADGQYDEKAGTRVREELLGLAGKIENCIYVLDGIFSDAAEFDDMTETYRSGLAMIQNAIAAISDVVIEMCAGIPLYLKGSEELWRTEPAADDNKRVDEDISPAKQEGKTHMEVVIGGACQGKTAYITEKYHLDESDICVCGPDKLPDFGCRCLTHAENYVLYAMRNGLELKTEFNDGTILVFDDLSCGIVPIDKETRLWREAAARYMTAMAAKAETVTRLSAGIPQVLKG